MPEIKKKKILVVDDDAAIRQLLETKLVARGMTVLLAANAKECLEQIQDSLPDLILLDVQMPGPDGLSLLQKLKKKEGTQHLPVIMISAAGNPDTVISASRSLANDFVVKPFHFEELFSRINQFLIEWDTPTVVSILEAVSAQDDSMLASGVLPEFKNDQWKAYRCDFRGVEVAALIQKNLKPDFVAKLSKERIRKEVVIFVKRTTGWNRVWPSEFEAGLYNKKAA